MRTVLNFMSIANRAAHSLARWSMLNSIFESFDLGNNPFAIVNVTLEEAVSKIMAVPLLFCFLPVLVFNKVFSIKKKKKKTV